MKDDLAAMKAVIGLTAEQAKETAVMESTDPKEILNSLSLDIQKTFPKLPQTSVEVKYVPKAMEAHLSPAFYMIPALDDTEENVIYVNQAQMGNKLTLYTTLAHEGYPGASVSDGLLRIDKAGSTAQYFQFWRICRRLGNVCGNGFLLSGRFSYQRAGGSASEKQFHFAGIVCAGRYGHSL